jgi:hypothetical protein
MRQRPDADDVAAVELATAAWRRPLHRIYTWLAT